MREDHEQTVALFQGAANSSDPDLAAFAKKTLPVLHQHESMIGQLPGGRRTAMAPVAAKSQ